MVELPKLAPEHLGLTPDEAALRLRELALVELFRRGNVSSGWAAKKLAISKDSFCDQLAEHDYRTSICPGRSCVDRSLLSSSCDSQVPVYC